MLSSIKNFLLKDHAYTQYFLYSVPGVNVFIRTFQSYHSLDNVNNNQDFNLRKKNFKSHMTTAICMQLALTVSTLALCILLPPATTIRLRINSIFTTSLALVLSNILCDSLWRSKMFVPRMAGTTNETGW